MNRYSVQVLTIPSGQDEPEIVTGATVELYNGASPTIPGDTPAFTLTEYPNSGLYYADVNVSGIYTIVVNSVIQTNKQGVYIDANDDAGIPVSRGTTYIWNKVALTNTISEQVLITGSGQLILGNLDSGHASLPTFTAPIRVEIDGTPYQDRHFHVSTDPSISSGNVTFGIKASVAGKPTTGSLYVDVKITQL